MDRSILFSAPMVLALLAGTKTQTRRVGKVKPGVTTDDLEWSGPPGTIRKGQVKADHIAVRFAVGDRLWVREAWHAARSLDSTKPRDIPRDADIEHAATARSYTEIGLKGKLRPGMFLPRWASRLTLTVTDVRVQRLQDISESDAVAEGIVRCGRFFGVADADWDSASTVSAVEAYANLWESINGAGAWDANPWVVAVSFTVDRRNIDEAARS